MTDLYEPFFNPAESLVIKSGGNLPHWHQNSKIQFVTFRLADSLPREIVSEIKDAIAKFNNAHPKPWSKEVYCRYRALTGRINESVLDRGYGSCILARSEVRDIVKESIMHGNGTDYDVFAFVIMPNHVHLLIKPLGEVTADISVGRIKHFSAMMINKLLGKSGKVWMRESFDRIVRNNDQLQRYIRYILSNPNGLSKGSYEIYLR